MKRLTNKNIYRLAKYMYGYCFRNKLRKIFEFYLLLPFWKNIGLLILLGSLIIYPISCSAVEKRSGQDLFIQHCSGCHINGGNIIRRGRTLKLKALKRYGFDNPQAIAEIARNGVGSMSGYQEFLGDEGDQLVGNWIWEQAQNAWTHG